MSTQAIQKAVFTVLERSREPISVRELMDQVRKERPEFSDVPDFDLRSAVLALTANGSIESTSTNLIELRPALAERG